MQRQVSGQGCSRNSTDQLWLLCWTRLTHTDFLTPSRMLKTKSRITPQLQEMNLTQLTVKSLNDCITLVCFYLYNHHTRRATHMEMSKFLLSVSTSLFQYLLVSIGYILFRKETAETFRHLQCWRGPWWPISKLNKLYKWREQRNENLLP